MFLEQVAIPLFRQVANVLKVQGIFDVFTPRQRMTLSETNADDLSRSLDTTGEDPIVSGRSRRGRGGS